MTTFKELGLNHEMIKGLDDLGFKEPTPIQEKSIQFILKSKKDLIALAQTGTGKTAAFGLPILNMIKTGSRELETIILCPTRELCIQISEDIKKLAKYSPRASIIPVYGGASIEIQIKALKRGCNIVVGTPGRVRDLINRKVLRLQSIKWLVLDEADEMLDMGFKDDLDAILGQTPKTRRTFLFSATMSQSVSAIAKQYMADREEISIGEKNVGAKNVSHEYYIVQAKDRFNALKRILDSLPGVYGILFCRTRNETQLVSDKLKLAAYDTEALHGDISQGMRTKIMDRFKRKQIRLLVATDVAARGIDVSNLTHIINYNLPSQDESYTHRTGRTGRADKYGVAISILTPRDARKVKELEGIIGKTFAYKKVPTGEEVYSKQIDCYIDEIVGTDIEKIREEKYFQESVEKLKAIKKEDLIKHIIAHKLKSRLNNYEDAHDLNANAKLFDTGKGSGDAVNLKINFGKNEGFDVKGLFKLFNSNSSLKGIEIGKISVTDKNTVFSIEKKYASTVEKQLKEKNFRGKKINIERSGTMPDYYEKKRGGGNRNFKRKRRIRKRR